MIFRARRLALVGLCALLLSGCSAAVDPDASPASAGGMIELAVSEACVDGSDPQCTAIGGDYVVLPSAFVQAAVRDAVVSDSPQQNAVEVTFTSDGAAVLNDLTNEAVQGGSESRLLFKIGGDVVAAVLVMEAVDGDQVTIALSPEEDPQQVVDLLHGT